MKKILVALLCLGLLTGCQSEKTSTSQVKAENGDVVNIDFVGKLAGKAFQGGTAEGYILELGSKTFIDGFEEQIVDMKVGSEKTIEVTFPENYQSRDLAGQKCEFDITLNKTYKETKAASQKGDFVKIDYVGKLKGEAFDGGSANGFLLELGSGQFVPGFEDQLMGLKATQTKEIDITFPSNYGSTTINGKTVSLANANVVFDVAINHVYHEAK
ncbi:FKBP-type peptidyl-prolyl cis-trans isomerase [Longibaculum muris]|uniref:FKBP-type peptidyl-prolyl cis-trans isomerase n=1 Tax=Longibaculum muris TaxID=1796628 RepID=UPI0012B93870|nr:FKBP-type peptidyl-prolyl cis-trans isomerase [Longibaculum muris]